MNKLLTGSSDVIVYFASMSLFITSLNSGSNGNCYYVGNKNEAVLIDAGISCRTIEKRIKNLELNIEKIQGIFISHEHTDHIKGVETLSKKYNIPVYISEGTYRGSRIQIDKKSLFHFTDPDTISIGDLKVHAFSKIHDANDPFSFCVTDGEVQVGVFTDIGHCCSNVVNWFKGCHAAFLEANYDEEMLQNGPYPYYLKQRISDGRGHLSNTIAHELFTRHRPEFMSHLILAHLSAQNNNPEIVEKLFKSNCGKIKIIVASRTKETGLFEITTQKSRPTYKQAVLNF